MTTAGVDISKASVAHGGRYAAASATRRASWIDALAAGRGFIAFGLYDAVFFLLAPVLTLAFVGLLSVLPPVKAISSFVRDPAGPAIFLMLVLSQAHAVAVFFRSHGNRTIFVRHRFAFVVVPVVLFAGLMTSDWAIAAAMVVAPFWAVYHLGMQSFGLGRMYDVRWGNDPTMGRSLDYWLQQFFNLAPFVAGWSLLPHLESFRVFTRVGWHAPSAWLDAHRSIEGALTGGLLVAGPLFLAFYVYSYRRLMKQGYRLCPQKIALLATTGVVSVWSWGFLSPWKAVFVMNVFHSVQYFALVWWAERGNLGRRSRLAQVSFGMPLLLVAFVAITVGLGVFLQTYGRDYTVMRWAASLALSVSLMHYWYDGFVWSVRRREA